MNKKIVRCLLVILVLLSTVSCKATKPYLVKDYLIELSYRSGISNSSEFKTLFLDLENWGVVLDEEINIINDDLTYEYLCTTIGRLIREDEPYEYLKYNGIISRNSKLEDKVYEEVAIKVIDKAVKIINNPTVTNKEYIDEKDVKHLDNYVLNGNILITNDSFDVGQIVYLEENNSYKKIKGRNNDGYIVIDPSIEEVFNEFKIEGSTELNLEDAEIIPYFEEEKIEYTNNLYELLANKRHTFNTNGYHVAYTINSSGIDVRLSKQAKNKMNMFFDVSLSNIKPTYKWDFKDGVINNAFFKVNFKLTNELGFSTGKYEKLYLDLQHLDSLSFLKRVNSSIKYQEDELECTIPVCKIKTPIPGVEVADFCIDLVLKVYVSGRIELVLYNEGELGFEIKEGKPRIINDVTKDSDFVVGASARAVAGINFNLECSKYRLMDIEFDGGARASVKSTLHLYDKDGNKDEVESDITYSILEEISKGNNDIRVCGDVSLNWVFDVTFNTSKAFLYKYGLTYTKHILDSSDQIFNNLTHIENFQFVKKCTRKTRKVVLINNQTNTSQDKKIILKKYSAVVNKGNTYKIPIVSIPSDYSENDLVYSSIDSSIVSVDTSGVIKGLNIGSCKVEVKTNDDKYKAYINILVSTG